METSITHRNSKSPFANRFETRQTRLAWCFVEHAHTEGIVAAYTRYAFRFALKQHTARGIDTQ
jgi:hypothetical protein